MHKKDKNMPNTQKEQSFKTGKRHKRAGYKRWEWMANLKAWRKVDFCFGSVILK